MADPLLVRGQWLLDARFNTPWDMYKFWVTTGSWRGSDALPVENMDSWTKNLDQVFRSET